ncbi:MAG TPA: glycogen synthase [Candidatus Nanopelagicales bacterium]|nr:glycogen synthase [Candidatus Nanopelagicales bacterium]
MRTAILTREWPPFIYGGAGVHVEHLVPELRKIIDVDVHCLGKPREDAQAHQVPDSLLDANPALQTIGADLGMADAVTDCDVAHSHTWYANLSGHLTGLLNDIPHVITAHSLEPRRPWKREQLGGGYAISSWVEKTAYRNAQAIIAVSAGMRADVLDCYPFVDPERVHVVHNGIDTQAYRRVDEVDALVSHGVDPEKPYVLFVGRITRQKGIAHLLRAAQDFDESVPIVLCAASPDTPELGAEVSAAIDALREKRDGVHWLNGHLERSDVRQLLSHALVFACPSVYEPLGIVNLEAMGCEAPVVASDVGGIPEVVVDGETGLLVHYDADEPGQFEADFATAINKVIEDPSRARQMGHAGRERAISDFGWDRIAARTVEVYEQAQAVHGS